MQTRMNAEGHNVNTDYKKVIHQTFIVFEGAHRSLHFALQCRWWMQTLRILPNCNMKPYMFLSLLNCRSYPCFYLYVICFPQTFFLIHTAREFHLLKFNYNDRAFTPGELSWFFLVTVMMTSKDLMR